MRIDLLTRNVASRKATAGAVAELKRSGAAMVMGTYDSSLSIPAAHAAANAGLVYWETGAVADQLTGEALHHVFRVGPSGSNLGTGSAVFPPRPPAPRLRQPPPKLRPTAAPV